uniref:helix-turn-helix domain-containing protein n=1 Tax=Alicyclobacillus tolerans TaxID=90970 RepID=UPI0027DF1036|nr:helix-turn-helix transcriptional regulator [Alicyclobacillus tolerans]
MIGQRIRELRKEKHMSLSELAKRADVAKSYLSTIERQIQGNPSIQVVTRIADVLEVPVQTLVEIPNTLPPHRVRKKPNTDCAKAKG